MSETEPIAFRPRGAAGATTGSTQSNDSRSVAMPAARFDRQELTAILDLYGRMVSAGEWRDYALDMGREKAVFSVYRRASEYPLYRIEKTPKLARKQGVYSVVSPTGLILKRGPDLKRVLAVLEKGMRVV